MAKKQETPPTPTATAPAVDVAEAPAATIEPAIAPAVDKKQAPVKKDELLEKDAPEQMEVRFSNGERYTVPLKAVHKHAKANGFSLGDKQALLDYIEQYINWDDLKEAAERLENGQGHFEHNNEFLRATKTFV